MKKFALICISLVLIGITIHLALPSYNGLPGIAYRVQGRIVSAYAKIVRDPGACALIRGHWGRSTRDKLRTRCVEEYIQNIVQKKSDCHIDILKADLSKLSGFWLREEYRSVCLLRHYQAMLGNSLTTQWLPPVCLEARDGLVVMSHYLQDVRLARANKTRTMITAPLTQNDISVIDQCEGFLDTPQIYAFLRDDAYTENEAAYIELQKSRVFKFR